MEGAGKGLFATCKILSEEVIAVFLENKERKKTFWGNR